VDRISLREFGVVNKILNTTRTKKEIEVKKAMACNVNRLGVYNKE